MRIIRMMVGDDGDDVTGDGVDGDDGDVIENDDIK